MATSRLLSIGEFAAATQLSLKALRLYDEQQLLRPARIDSASGYRYYRSDQVSIGRLIRTLRDMGLPLADIARVAVAEGVWPRGCSASLPATSTCGMRAKSAPFSARFFCCVAQAAPRR